MKACIVGAGAIGGWIGVKLGQSGSALSVLARGTTLEALRARGLTLHSSAGTVTVPVRASADARELGVQDLVVIAVKAPALAQVAGSVAPLLGPATIVLTAMNGVPWWFFDGFGGRWAGTRL